MSGTFSEDEDDLAASPPLWRQRHVQFIAAGVVGIVALAWTHGGGSPKPQQTPAKTEQPYIGQVVPYTPPKVEAPPPPAPAPAPQPVAPQPVIQPAPVATVMPQALPAVQPMPQRFQQAKAAPSDRPAMASFAPREWSSVPSSEGSGGASGAAGSQAGAQTRLAYAGTDIPAAKASAAMDETFMLDPGLLPCVLDTAIDSDLPGPLMCHLPGPIYSKAGVLLMEAGTVVQGKYESVSRAGQNRLQAVTTFAHTPNGVWVPLAGGPMADDLGRSGLPGEMDQRLFARFGAATLLSLTDSALNILQASQSKGGNSYLSFSSGGGVTSLAQDVLRSQINIPPVFRKHQGEAIALWITQPIDFSAAYKIKPIK